MGWMSGIANIFMPTGQEQQPVQQQNQRPAPLPCFGEPSSTPTADTERSDMSESKTITGKSSDSRGKTITPPSLYSGKLLLKNKFIPILKNFFFLF